MYVRVCACKNMCACMHELEGCHDVNEYKVVSGCKVS